MKNLKLLRVLAFIIAIAIHALILILLMKSQNILINSHYHLISVNMVAPTIISTKKIDSKKVEPVKKPLAKTILQQKIDKKPEKIEKLIKNIEQQKKSNSDNLVVIDEAVKEQYTSGKISPESLEKNSAIKKPTIASYLNNPSPQYPNQARFLGQQGTVILDVVIKIDGRPKEVKIAKSSGYEILDQAALETVAMWEFIPAKQGNIKIESQVKIPITFKID